MNECPCPSHWETACSWVDFLVKKPTSHDELGVSFLRHPKTRNLLACWEVFPKNHGLQKKHRQKNMAISIKHPEFQYDLHLQSSVFETTTSHIIIMQFTTSDKGDKLSTTNGPIRVGEHKEFINHGIKKSEPREKFNGGQLHHQPDIGCPTSSKSVPAVLHQYC